MDNVRLQSLLDAKEQENQNHRRRIDSLNMQIEQERKNLKYAQECEREQKERGRDQEETIYQQNDYSAKKLTEKLVSLLV